MKKFLNEEIVIKEKVWKKLLNAFVISIIITVGLAYFFIRFESPLSQILIKLQDIQLSNKIEAWLLMFPIILIICEMIQLANIVIIQSKNKKRTLK